MTDDMAVSQAQVQETSEYQLEMFNKSLKWNIAVLRLKLEAECESCKGCCPCRCTTAALLTQPSTLDLTAPHADRCAYTAAAGRH